MTEEERRAYHRDWYHKNKEKVREQQKANRLARRDEINALQRKRRAENRDEVNRKFREWCDKNRERYSKLSRRRHILVTYGLTQEAYDALLVSQGGKCAICRRERWGAKRNTPHVDHDHATGKVRGLLCTDCNTSLGKLGDGEQGLLRALAYVRGELDFSKE
jgi:hypothetical protein